jgi:hypothetical protein
LTTDFDGGAAFADGVTVDLDGGATDFDGGATDFRTETGAATWPRLDEAALDAAPLDAAALDVGALDTAALDTDAFFAASDFVDAAFFAAGALPVAFANGLLETLFERRRAVLFPTAAEGPAFATDFPGAGWRERERCGAVFLRIGFLASDAIQILPGRVRSKHQ